MFYLPWESIIRVQRRILSKIGFFDNAQSTHESGAGVVRSRIPHVENSKPINDIGNANKGKGMRGRATSTPVDGSIHNNDSVQRKRNKITE